MRVYLFTLGCKVNQYETAALSELLASRGFEITDDPDNADICVINSCTVTSSGDRKSLQKLRHLKKNGCITVLCGCYPQAFPEKAKAFFDADIVTGNASRSTLPDIINDYLKSKNRIVDISAHSASELFEPLKVEHIEGRTRAFLKIEDGCERFCSYCIIPKARGSVRSLPLNLITEEAKRLAAFGYHEIVLTGINLSCYGKDIGADIADAVAACSVDGVIRVRLSSLEPDILTEKILAKLAACSRLCPQFHLALQSGCDSTLARMRRRYNTKMYLKVADRLRELFPKATFSTDVIVGFPGETEADFKESFDFITGFGFLKCHIFPYSQRTGTPAAEMPDQVTKSVKEQRTRTLSRECDRVRSEILLSAVGRRVRVIAEKADQTGWNTGFTDEYYPVHILGTKVDVGCVAEYTVTGLSDGVLTVE